MYVNEYKGYKGISFPFRINNQGGVAMSSTSYNNVKHIEESIQQILGTGFLERVMESDFYSNVHFSLFEPNDNSLQTVVKSQIVDALTNLEERIELTEDGIELYEEDGELYVTLNYLVTKYQTWNETTVKVGEVNE